MILLRFLPNGKMEGKCTFYDVVFCCIFVFIFILHNDFIRIYTKTAKYYIVIARARVIRADAEDVKLDKITAVRIL